MEKHIIPVKNLLYSYLITNKRDIFVSKRDIFVSGHLSGVSMGISLTERRI